MHDSNWMTGFRKLDAQKQCLVRRQNILTMSRMVDIKVGQFGPGKLPITAAVVEISLLLMSLGRHGVIMSK